LPSDFGIVESTFRNTRDSKFITNTDANRS